MSANMNVLSSQIGEQFKKGLLKSQYFKKETTVLKKILKN